MAETVALCQVTLESVAEPTRRLNGRVWISRGVLSHIQFSKVPADVGFAEYAEVQCVERRLLTDPLSTPMPGAPAQAARLRQLVGCHLEEVGRPADAGRITAATVAFDGRLPPEYLELIGLADGFRSGRIRVFGTGNVQILPTAYDDFLALGLVGDAWLGVAADGTWSTLGPDQDVPSRLPNTFWQFLRDHGDRLVDGVSEEGGNQ